MLARGPAILARAVAEQSAVPALVTHHLAMVPAVVAAAEQTARPVIMLAGSSHCHHAGRSALISIALQAAHESTAAVGVHLDHGPDLAEIGLCVQAGHTPVMVDGSHLHARVPRPGPPRPHPGCGAGVAGAARCQAARRPTSSAGRSGAGGAKINIDTELRQAHLAAFAAVLPSVVDRHDRVAWWRAGRQAVTTAAVRSIHALTLDGLPLTKERQHA